MKRKTYVRPRVKLTQVILESNVLVQCSSIKREEIRVDEWEDGETQASGDGDVHLHF